MNKYGLSGGSGGNLSDKEAYEKSVADGYLAGKLILSMPVMGDPRFQKSVIFICSHNEDGAMGLVVNNRFSGIEFKDIVNQIKMESDDGTYTGFDFDSSGIEIPVLNGGPVEPARGFLLHSLDFQRDETVIIGDKYGVTATVEALKEVIAGKVPKQMLFIMGYAGWSAGQLDWEIQQNTWLVTEASPDIIFMDNLDGKWDKAIKQMGIDPAMLSVSAGSA